jgi:hypothetical protein
MVWAFGPGHEVLCLVFAVVDSVDAAVHVYQIRWDIKSWNGIIEHIAVQFKGVPMSPTHPVATLASMNCGKVERAVDVRVGMCQVDVRTVWE